MPSPSENRAIDLIMAAFPGSELLLDTTKRLPPKAERMVIHDGWEEKPRITKPKPPPGTRKRRKKLPPGQESLL